MNKNRCVVLILCLFVFHNFLVAMEEEEKLQKKEKYLNLSNKSYDKKFCFNDCLKDQADVNIAD